MSRELFALSVRQPWAWLFFQQNGKDVENRTWATKYRGPLLIHTGANMDFAALQLMRSRGYPLPAQLPLGGYVGAVMMTDCKRYQECRSPWAEPCKYCFHFEERRPLPRFIESKGRQGIFRVPDYIAIELERVHFVFPGEKPCRSRKPKPKPSNSVPCLPNA